MTVTSGSGEPLSFQPKGDRDSINISNAARWVIVGLIFIEALINYMDRATISVSLPLISSDLHLDASHKGYLLSAFFWSYALLQIPMGRWADRSNLKWLTAGTFAFWSLACALTYYASTFRALLILRVALGIGESVFVPCASRIVNLLFAAHERGFPLGIYTAGARLGLAFSSPLIAYLVGAYGWHRMFLLVGTGSLVWLLPWLSFFPGWLGRLSRRAAGPTEAPERLVPRTRRASFRNLFGLCLGHFCFGYFLYLLVTWLPTYLVDVHHLSVRQAGFYSTLPYFAFGASELIGGGIGDLLIRIGVNETLARKGLVTFAFATGLLLIPAGMATSASTAVWVMAASCLLGLASGNILAILLSLAPSRDIGLWSGILNFSGNIPGIVAPIATGLLLRSTGSYMPGFIVAVILLGLGILPYWFIVEDLGHASNANR